MTAPEFSRLVSVHRLGAKTAHHKIAAEASEREALARRFGLLSLDRLEAEVALSRESGGGVRLDATLGAELVQACVMTLEPVPATLEDRFTIIYRPGIDEDEADRLTFETDEDIVVEPLPGDAIDIGEIVAQQLSLVMDPFPKLDGAALEAEPDAEPPVEGRHPFAALGSLGRKA
ncbi:MAG TPA: DUF177 domain-containing protein [Stellaceae bacterium]|nr:DUF177 domain-containing protein [Stellaceae bacterium]